MGATKKMKEQMDFEQTCAQVQSAITRHENGDSVQSALLSVQLGLKAPKDNVNQFAHFNYRTAGQILEKVKPFLAECGCILIVDDSLEQMGDRYYIHSRVTFHHIASGEEIVSNGYAREALIEKGKMDAQMTGCASTFAKKYALCNLFCIDDSSEEPDGKDMESNSRWTTAMTELQTARSNDDLARIVATYPDLKTDPTFISEGKAARDRINNH